MAIGTAIGIPWEINNGNEVPDNALLNEDDSPILNEDGSYILTDDN